MRGRRQRRLVYDSPVATRVCLFLARRRSSNCRMCLISISTVLSCCVSVANGGTTVSILGLDPASQLTGIPGDVAEPEAAFVLTQREPTGSSRGAACIMKQKYQNLCQQEAGTFDGRWARWSGVRSWSTAMMRTKRDSACLHFPEAHTRGGGVRTHGTVGGHLREVFEGPHLVVV